MSDDSNSRGGWRISRSIAVELDVAAYFVRMGPEALPKDLADLAMSIPPAWFEEFDALGPYAPPERGLQSIVEHLARWAGVVEEEDYDVASAAMREITVEDAIEQVAATSGLQPVAHLEPIDRLLEIDRRLATELPARFDLYPPSDADVAERERHALLVAAGALRGEALHGRFWHWLDRFYYEAYRPWRLTRLDAMAAGEREVTAFLGGAVGTQPPALDWLPASNPILANPTLRDAVIAGNLEVTFWLEPFGLSDTWSLYPGRVLTSFAERGAVYDHFRAVRDELAAKLKAVADPTRLSILRMVRMHDLDNTQVAGHLDVSRPTVSVHAKVLADAGLITTSRAGRQARHAFHPDALRRLCADLLSFLDVPDRPRGGSPR